MKRLISILTLLFGLITASAVNAGIPIPYGSSGKMVFMTETDLTDEDGARLSLCSLWTRQHVAFVGYWGSQIYVLSTDNCESDWYYDYSPTQMVEDRIAGLIPADIPNEPQLTIGFAAFAFMAWGAVALIGLIWANGALSDSAKVRKRQKLLGDVHPYVERMVAVMTHAARSDGNISDVEIELMRKTVREYAGVTVSIEDILRVINITPKIKTDAQFKELGRGLDATGRENMFHAGLAMIAADGVLQKSERKWLSRLGTGLGYKGRDMKRIFEEINATATQPAEA